jgi:hypothetical protein
MPINVRIRRARKRSKMRWLLAISEKEELAKRF